MFLNFWFALLAVTVPLFELGARAQNPTNPAGGYFALTGVHTGITETGARPSRKNILDLQNDLPAWSLYIQALNAMQNASDSDPFSFFVLAGVHGRPFEPWNGFNQYQDPQWNWWKGYCPHGSVLFLSWHTPYLALFEQVMAQYAQSIAKQYTGPDLAIYQSAADNLRIAYWDWAAIPEMPAVLSQPTIAINTPTGPQTVDNPLHQYTFPNFPLNPTLFPEDMARRQQTVRQPESGDPNAPSRPDLINAVLANQNLKQRTWDALVKPTEYNNFATQATDGASIESVHNSIHLVIGGDFGTMTPLEYSAFDPIFWLHHCNVDRLYAIWMAMNPGKTITPMGGEFGTMSIPYGNVDTSDTPLWPFTSDAAGTVYTSNSVYKPSVFGYTYPEIEDWNQTPENLRANVTAQVNAKYDPNSIFGAPPTTAPTLRRRNTYGRAGQETKEWSMTIDVNKFALEGAHFAVRIFLGCVPEDPKDWATCDTGLGSMQVMPPSLTNTTDIPFMAVHDEFSLTRAIADADINIGNTTAVKEYLTENLQWRVQKTNGTVVDLKDLPSLNVTVGGQKMTLQKNITSLPTYGTRTVYHEITQQEKPATTEQLKPSFTSAGSFHAMDGRLSIFWALFVILLLEL